MLVFLMSLLISTAQAGSLSSEEKALQLLNRLSYGPRPTEVQALAKQGNNGIQHWIEEQLHPEKIDDRHLEGKISQLPITGLDTLQLMAQYQDLNKFIERDMGASKKDLPEEELKQLRKKYEDHLIPRILEDMQAQRLIRAVESRRQLEEVLFDFWWNHFNVDWSKGPVRWMAPSYEREAIRHHIFGSFIDLLRATAHHPAMLVYLDNHVSRVAPPAKNGKKPNGGLNENYARELMELHTLGVDGGYTQKDVTELARILTGWSVENTNDDPVFAFKEKNHDKEAKVFLNHTFPAGGGLDEGERALEMLAENPNTAKFISLKLARYFVSDNPPESLVLRLQKEFLKTHGNLTAVYRALFNSPEFWSRTSYQAKVKRPLQFVASSIRALGGELDVKTPLPKILADLGEELYKCAPPTGYKDDASTWVNPGALVSRLDFSLKLAANRMDGVFVTLPQKVKPTEDLKSLVNDISKKLLGQPLSKGSAEVVMKELSDESRTFANGELRPISLAKATALILGSPEFQKR